MVDLLKNICLCSFSLLKFHYVGKRSQTAGKTSMAIAPAQTNGFRSRKANTLPARMEPPAFGSDASFIEDTHSPVSESKSRINILSTIKNINQTLYFCIFCSI